ncbi:hypothetical protein Tco_0417076 [Tanacetum coccineum]
MADSQLPDEGPQRGELEGARAGSQERPSEPALLTQTTPSPAFIKENINVLRTMIKEHNQQDDGDWFSFAKRRNSEDVCMDDGPSSMKKWKKKFFLIDRRAIPDYLTWRHSHSCVVDDLPLDGYC